MRSIRKSTIVFASVIMMSLIMSGIFLGNRVEAKELGDGSVSIEYNDIAEYYGKKAPAYQEGYLFAGWYKDDACTQSYAQSDETVTSYYAKFVPKEVLSVKTQIETTLLDKVLDDGTAGGIRFVTSVDSLNYQKVGLKVKGTIGTVSLDRDYSLTTVYDYLYVVNSEEEPKEKKTAAQEFSPASKYFAPKAFKIKFSQFSSDFNVTPYWITSDGVLVEGVPAVRSMVDGLEYSSYAEVNKRAYYRSNDIFEIAMAMNETEAAKKIWADEGSATATMTVLKDVVISGQTSFEGKTTITNKAGKAVTIKKANTWNPNSSGACLLYTRGKELTVAGASSEAGITIDGGGEKAHIRNNSIFQAENVTFTNGFRSGTGVGEGIGGAINAAKNDESPTESTTTTIKNCAFEKNKAEKDGGAIYVVNGSLSVTDSAFSRNQAETEHGGAIFAGTNAKVTLTTSSEQKSFENNKAVAGSGGAIMIDGAGAELTVNGYTFKNNEAQTFGGAIRFCNGASFGAESCDFTGNIANAGSGSAGGAIYAQKDATVKKCTFTSNSAPNFSGGAVAAKGVLTVEGGTFTGNNAKTNGGAIYVTEKTGSLQLIDSTVDGNYTTAGHGGAIAVMTAAESNIINTVFYKNEARGNGTGGGALHVTAATCNVISCEFGKEDAANTAKTYGGAIYVTGGTGILNLAVDASKGSHKSFGYNTAVNGGGAIAARGNGTAKVDGYTFVGNTVTGEVIDDKGANADKDKNGGGAIYAGSKTEVKNSTFTSNSGGDGGTILAQDKTNKVVVENCEFKQNSSSHRGAAVYVQKGAKGIEITGSHFNQNTTTGHGGAIFARAGVDISNCEFNSNKATNAYGGAIDQELGEGTVKTSVFYGNSSATGGAVASTGGKLTLTNCDFNKKNDENVVVGNTASKGGVAGATGNGQVIMNITDATERSLTGNTTTSGNLYAQNGASIQYSSFYKVVVPATGGSPAGTITQLEE